MSVHGPLPLFLDSARAHAVRRNLLSIYELPYAVLPRGLARSCLAYLAGAGHDVYAYADVVGGVAVWCVWLGPLGDRRTVAQWHVEWPQLLPRIEFELAQQRRRTTAPPPTTLPRMEVAP